MNQEEKLCDDVEKVRVFTYLGDSVGAGGRYKAAMTAKTRCRLVKLTECGELV